MKVVHDAVLLEAKFCFIGSDLKLDSFIYSPPAFRNDCKGAKACGFVTPSEAGFRGHSQDH